MEDFYILGIETSCDETSASIIKNGIKEIGTVTSSQIDIHKKYGGVIPELASRNHIENITIVLERLLIKTNMKIEDIDGFAVTYGPGLLGSLMIGIETAKVLSFIYNKPLIPVHHIIGHIYACRLVNEFKFPLIALVVSGGHTDLIYMEDEYKFKKIGQTIDDAVGEAYDKVAKIIGLDYPGGPVIDKLAAKGKKLYDLPIPLKKDPLNFSFSGLKTAVINLVHNEKQTGKEINKENLATSFQNVVINILTEKTMRAVKEYNVQQLLLAGGVAANKGLRNKLIELTKKSKVDLLMPLPRLCTDNAAMIGVAGYYAYQKKIKGDLSLIPISTENL